MNHATWYNISPAYKGQAHMTKLYDKRTLTNDQAVAICLDKRTQDEVAEDYGISRAQVSRIQHGHRYANVTEHVRDKKAFSLKVSDLQWKHKQLLAEAERVAKQIEQLESLQRCTPDEMLKEENLAKYRALVGR